MAEPFDTIAASVADVIDRLAKGEITEAQAATSLSPLLAAVNDGEFATRVEEIVGVVGRITGLLMVEAPPSNLLGAPGSYAWDRIGKVFYGPKHPVTGWPAGDAMTEGPPGPTVELRTSSTHVQWRVAGTSSWINLATLASLKGADGAQVSLQTTATHVQWRLGTGAWANLIARSDLKGDTGATPNLGMTAETGAAGSAVEITKSGPPEAPTFVLTIPRGDRGEIGPTPVLAIGDVVAGAEDEANATLSGTPEQPILNLMLPRGPKGDRGDAFAVNAQGTLSGRAAYDAEAVGFSYLDVDAGNLYFRVEGGGWSPPIPFGKGDPGEPAVTAPFDFAAYYNSLPEA